MWAWKTVRISVSTATDWRPAYHLKSAGLGLSSLVTWWISAKDNGWMDGCFLTVTQLPRNAQHYFISSTTFTGIANFFTSNVWLDIKVNLGKRIQCWPDWPGHITAYLSFQKTPGSQIYSHMHQRLWFIVCHWLTASPISELEQISCLSLFLHSPLLWTQIWLTCVNTF